MKSLRYYLANPKALIIAIMVKYLTWLPDKVYLSFLYRIEMGYWINWKNPQTFNEKLQWLKLYNRNPKYTTMVDKYAVKDYVASIIGNEYIIPTLGVWNTPEEIDFESLPDKFVLKTTHGGGGGGIVICRAKATFDVDAARRKLNCSLKSDIYKNYREWPYKNVPRRIIAEKFIEFPDKTDLTDYKFFCFKGEPQVMLVSHGRFQGVTCFDYYDMDFNHLPFEQGGPNAKFETTKPKNFDLMKQIASQLSYGIPHVRVDLYNCDGKIYFGELTFFDSSGFAEFKPKEWDYKFGNWINLNKAIW